jgi:hypothetical protein
MGKAMAGLDLPDKPDPQYWRDRAKKTHADAERMTDRIAKRLLFAVADSYDRLAGRIDERLRVQGKKST